MSLIQFVQNYEDLSTDKGYQFKFHCDKCHNGFMTRFQPSTFGMAESALRVAGSLFGGVFNTVGNSAFEIQRAIGGPAHDAALQAAVAEGKEYFQQCKRCGLWVCPEVCWNPDAALCQGCAPKYKEELASAYAQEKTRALRQELFEKARNTDLVKDVDMSVGAVVSAAGPKAGAADRCTSCGGPAGSGRFCPQCGAPRAAAGCPECGAPVQPNAQFCAGCGHKLA